LKLKVEKGGVSSPLGPKNEKPQISWKILLELSFGNGQAGTNARVEGV